MLMVFQGSDVRYPLLSVSRFYEDHGAEVLLGDRPRIDLRRVSIGLQRVGGLYKLKFDQLSLVEEEEEVRLGFGWRATFGGSY